MERRKTISNSRRPGPLTDGCCWEKEKLNGAEEPGGASGKGEDVEVRGCLAAMGLGSPRREQTFM